MCVSSFFTADVNVRESGVLLEAVCKELCTVVPEAVACQLEVGDALVVTHCFSKGFHACGRELCLGEHQSLQRLCFGDIL